MSISVRSVSRRFGRFVALEDVSLDIADGELVALLGPSGSGKTTLLRIIAGLETADTGEIVLAGREATHTPPQERQVGFVFQHYALFRHLSVADNIAFGLRVRPKATRPSLAEIHRRVDDLLRLVQLEPFARHRPWQLSGGQRQRVALARALAIEPRVLLLDEPFGALDAQVRKELRRWLRRLHDELGMTSVFVTHDQEEALEVADRVVVFRDGRIEQVGTPQDIYERPVSAFVHRFIGEVNVLRGEAADGMALFRDGPSTLRWPLPAGSALAGAVDGYFRPHEVELRREAEPGTTLPARLMRRQRIGPSLELELSTPVATAPIEVHLGPSHAPDWLPAISDGMILHLRPYILHLFPAAAI
jgi:sulfate transport system ATP-binding protein